MIICQICIYWFLTHSSTAHDNSRIDVLMENMRNYDRDSDKFVHLNHKTWIDIFDIACKCVDQFSYRFPFSLIKHETAVIWTSPPPSYKWQKNNPLQQGSWGQHGSGADRTQVGPCWPYELCYLRQYLCNTDCAAIIHIRVKHGLSNIVTKIGKIVSMPLSLDSDGPRPPGPNIVMSSDQRKRSNMNWYPWKLGQNGVHFVRDLTVRC